jgi:flagellar basal body-associated protein FliL
MEAGEPSRKKKPPTQIIIEILGTAIALTTLTLPIVLITNFSQSSNPNSTPSNPVSIP